LISRNATLVDSEPSCFPKATTACNASRFRFTAGAPDEYTGLAYVDLSQASDLIREYLGLAGGTWSSSPAVKRNLEALHAVVAFGKQDGSLSTNVAFLEIK
jgi:hypothetical protein